MTFSSFGESGLDLRLKVAIATREQRGSVTHDLHLGLLDELRREGIEIALPQRDVRVRLEPSWPHRRTVRIAACWRQTRRCRTRSPCQEATFIGPRSEYRAL